MVLFSGGGNSDQEVETLHRTGSGATSDVDYSNCELDRIIDRMVGKNPLVTASTSSPPTAASMTAMAQQLIDMGSAACMMAGGSGGPGGGTMGGIFKSSSPAPLFQGQSLFIHCHTKYNIFAVSVQIKCSIIFADDLKDNTQ